MAMFCSNGVKAGVLAQALDTQRARAVALPPRHNFGGLQIGYRVRKTP